DPEPYVRKYHIDRTAPFILLPFTTPHSTNETSFELPFTISDMSPFSFKVYVNGILTDEFDSPSGELSDAVAVELEEGINFVRIEAVDIVGNTSHIDYPSLFLDTTPPTLASINIGEGDLIRTQEYLVEGRASESLKSVVINGLELDLEDTGFLNFSENLKFLVDGAQTLRISLTDLAGNTSDYQINFNFLLRLLDPNLISVQNSDQEGKLRIVGYRGASIGGVKILGEGGFVNTDGVYSNVDGSIDLLLDQCDVARVTGFEGSSDRREATVVRFKADTTLAGQVR